jgi:hypothetical protein
MAWHARQLAVATVLVPTLALVRLPVGAPAPPVTVEDTEGHARTVPDAHLPLVLLYEDQDAGKQNPRAREVLGKFTDVPQNRTRFEFMAVADLEKWNWWPARKYALADLRKIARRENTVLWCDWKGLVRRAWGLQRGKSSILMLGVDGKVLFAGEGTLSEAQLKELAERLVALGATPKP